MSTAQCPLNVQDIVAIAGHDLFFSHRLAACRHLDASDLLALPEPVSRVLDYPERLVDEDALAYYERMSSALIASALAVTWEPLAIDQTQDACPLSNDELIDCRAQKSHPCCRRPVIHRV